VGDIQSIASHYLSSFGKGIDDYLYFCSLKTSIPSNWTNNAQTTNMSQVKEYHINNSSISIYFGNILQTKADVIVSSDDTNITMGGGVSGAIRREEGTGAISQDVNKKTPAEVGDVIVSTAGSLPQMYILHVITLDYGSVGHSKIAGAVSKEDIQKYIIAHSIDKCFLLLHALDLKSIAFPAIGAGIAGFPLEKVASVMSEAIARNLRIVASQTYMMTSPCRMSCRRPTAPTTPPPWRPTASPKTPPRATSSPASSRCIRN
jgi:O-acetyl-ADP-ribose deacetylase (regulator of RNase III)